jgi:hypothetical protein
MKFNNKQFQIDIDGTLSDLNDDCIINLKYIRATSGNSTITVGDHYVSEGISIKTMTKIKDDTIKLENDMTIVLKRESLVSGIIVIEFEGADDFYFKFPELLPEPKLSARIPMEFMKNQIYNPDCSEIYGSNKNSIRCTCQKDIGTMRYSKEVLKGAFEITARLSYTQGTAGLYIINADHPINYSGKDIWESHPKEQFGVSQNSSNNHCNISDGKNRIYNKKNIDGPAFCLIKRDENDVISIKRNNEWIYTSGKIISEDLRVLCALQCSPVTQPSSQTYIEDLRRKALL